MPIHRLKLSSHNRHVCSADADALGVRNLVQGLMTDDVVGDAAAQTFRAGTITVRCAREEDTYVLELDGELDVGCVEPVSAEIKRIEQAVPAVSRMVIDLRKLRFMDSTGLRVLVQAHMSCQQRGVQLRLVAPTAEVERLLRLTGLYEQLPIVAEP